MVKYIVPLEGSGTADDPIRPMIRPLKEKRPIVVKRTVMVEKKTGNPVTIFDIIEKGLKRSDIQVITKEEKIGEQEVYYNCHIDIPNGVAIFETDKKIPELEQLVKAGKVKKE